MESDGGKRSQHDEPDAKSQTQRVRVLACSGSLDGGGSERQLWQFVSHLDRQRFAPEVYLLARRGIYLQQLPGDVPVHAFDDSTPQPRRFPPGHISRLQARHLRHIVKARNIDVVYDRTFHLTLLTGTACRVAPPRVSVIVSPPSRDLLGTERRWVWLKRWLLARAYRSAAATICVSTEVADDAAAFYALPRERLIVIPNPVDVAQVRLQAEQVDMAGLLPSPAERRAAGQLHVAVIGRFTVEKGQRFAIEVIAEADRQARLGAAASPTSISSSGQLSRLKAVHLHLVGSGPLESQLKELARSLGVAANVHFHGYLTNPYPLLQNCDLAFVPSQYEGFPNVALEALALGVPLMMTNYGATALEILGTAGQRGELIPVGGSAAAVAALEDRWQNPQRWSSRAWAGREWVQREHSLEPWLTSMSSLLERVKRKERIVGEI